MIFWQILLVLIVFFLIIWQLSNLLAYFLGSPFIRTPRKGLKEILDLAEFSANEQFYDLGSGFGQALRYVQKKYRVRCFGWEASPFHFLVSWLLLGRNEQIEIHFADFNEISFENVDVVYCRLSGRAFQNISKKFLKELKKGSRLICYKNSLPDMEPYFVYQVDRDKIYFYKF